MSYLLLFQLLALNPLEWNSYIVRSQNPSGLADFAREKGYAIEPLVNYPDLSPEAIERFGNYYVLTLHGEEVLAQNPPGTITAIPNKRNRVEKLESFTPPTVPPLLQDTVLYDYHIPNDEYFYNQWCKLITETQWAWQLTLGTKDVVVGILDTGIDTLHDDLKANFIGGANLVSGSASIQDGHGHGTSMSGIVAAEIDNGIGIAGISQSSLMMIKMVNDSGFYVDADLIEGIIYAADHGVNILSMSLEGDETEPIALIQEAVEYAWDKGCLLCAISGNDGKYGSDYPGAYEHVMSVGASTKTDQRAFYSNYGDKVDILAPGDWIYTTALFSDYYAYKGTSMACPQVAGLAALIWCVHPEWTNQEVLDKIISSADTIDTDMGQALRMNSRKALDIIAGAEEEMQISHSVRVSMVSSEEITLKYEIPGPSVYSFKVFDASGSMVLHESGYAGSQGELTTGIPLTRGVYFYSFQTRFGASRGKLVSLSACTK